jgi:hypothetical protein
MSVLKQLNIALSFVLEIAMLAAYAHWGYHAVTGPLRWLLAIAAPLLAAVVWGLFLAPKATRRLGSAAGIIVSTVLFLLAGLALFASGQPGLGIAMLALTAVNRALLAVWKQW